MKMIAKTIVSIVLTLLFTAFATGTSHLTHEYQYDPTGVWSYEVVTPDGTQTGEMMIEKNGDTYEVTIESDIYGTLELEKVKFSKTTLEGELELEGSMLDFEMDFNGDAMEGTIYMGESEFSLEAKRKKE